MVSNHWSEGGAGAVALAEATVATCEAPSTSSFKFLYDLDLSINEKIESIAKNIYGADGIELSDLAKKQVETYTKQGYGNLPSTFPVYHHVHWVIDALGASLYGQDPVLLLA